MAIVSSSYILDAPTEKDGRRYVTETHTDSIGVVHTVTYLAAVGVDHTATMNARAITIAEQLADQEFQELING